MSIFSRFVRWWNNKPFTLSSNYFVFNNTPQWLDLKDTEALFDQFCTNPVYHAVIMIKARETANMKLFVENISTGEIEPEDTKKTIPREAYRILKNPNPFQSRWEFLYQYKIFREVAGNAFIYATSPFKTESALRNITNITSLKNIWPQYMRMKATGKYFEATELKDVIEKWEFDADSYKKEFDPTEILHRNNPNVDTKNNLVLGRSIGFSLQRPLSNIMMAYESRNVLLRNRGMRGVFTSEKGDATGRVHLQPNEKESVEKEMKGYGNLEGQKPFFFSSYPLKFTPIDQDVRKLGLFEEIATDTMIVAQNYGVPEILVKAYLEGTTFENQEASVRRLYQGTIIPEAMDDVEALNLFLGLNDTGFRIIGSFEHIPALQKSEKDKASAYEMSSKYLEKLFLIGGVTLNTWLDQLELPLMDNGDRTIFEMDETERNIIVEMMGKRVQAEGPQNGQEPKSLNGQLKEILN